MQIRDAVKNQRLLVAGHRGYSAQYPENTLLSIQKGMELGVDMIEIDIALSKDGVPVLCHDDTLDRTTNGSGYVSDFTLEELKTLDAGIKRGLEFKGLRIPSFEEVCDFMRDYPGVLLNVDLKYGEQVLQATEIVLDLVEKYNYGQRCVFNSLDGRVTALTHELDLFSEGAPLGFYGMSHFDTGENGTYSKMDAVCLNIRDVRREEIQRFQDQGLFVWCWGTDDEESVRRAVDCGISLVVCNDPRAAVTIRDEMAIS